jgi:hypothetical protein
MGRGRGSGGGYTNLNFSQKFSKIILGKIASLKKTK